MRHHKTNKFDLAWIISLFGTAVGAGILFLPINAGMGGFYPLLIVTILVGPMTYLSHLGLSRFVNSTETKELDITQVVKVQYGERASLFISILYFFSIFPILLIYGVGITNTVNSLLVNQLHFPEPNRLLLSLILVSLLLGVMLLNERLILRITEILVYPLIGILLLISLYLIPQWNLAFISAPAPSLKEILVTIWTTLPVLVFAFNHSPAISTFTTSQQHHYKTEEVTEQHIQSTLRKTATLLLGFVMLFVFSVVLSLSPADLAQAKQENLPVLSYLANKFDNPMISVVAPLIAFLAIGSSFFGHYYGAREGLRAILHKLRKDDNYKAYSDEESDEAAYTATRKSKLKYALIFLVPLWLVAYYNPSILSVIESFGGPILAALLFVLPVYSYYKLESMSKYRKSYLANAFVLVMGLLVISSVFYALVI